MHKIISLLLSLCISVTCANAESITKVINSLNVNKSAVSISIKEIESGKSVYSLNEKTPMIPASTLKLITSSAAADTLGIDYKFSTKMYKSTNNDLYIKLGADPFLSSMDLKTLIDAAKEKNIISPKNIYLDASIFDSVEWGEGWQWDADLNILMPKFSAYNLDGNLLRVEISPNADNTPASISVKPFYPVTFMNLVNSDSASGLDNINLSRNNSIAPNIIEAKGFVSKTNIVKIPVNNTKRYFILRMEDAIRDKKLDYYAPIKNANLPQNNIYLVGEICHELPEALNAILKSSNNLAAETLFKLGGAVWAKAQGTTENSLKMLNAYFEKLNIKNDDIKIVDGSGVSKNNLVTADFMTEFLVIKSHDTNFEVFKNFLPTSGEGTLKNRMLYFKDNLKAKTGTLSDTSAIAGYLTSRKGKTYAFDIMINDAKSTPADKKNLEEQVLRLIYTNY